MGSLPTGQMLTQAAQAVQAQTADSLMAKSIRLVFGQFVSQLASGIEVLALM